MQLKRLWDITNKKMVFVKGPTGHDCQLWVDEATEKMYYYDMSQWLEYTQSSEHNGRTYGPTWKVVDGDDEMGVYDTNEPTDLFVWESGDKVSYVFKNYDGTVLKEGKVNEGTAPTPPADPTKPSTAAETFTFTGWNPTVAPITKKTTYTAQYEASPRNYTVTIGVSPEGAGTVDTQQVTVAYGTEISYTSNVLMIGSNEITATAGSGYDFSSWGTLPEAVTSDLTITATFEASTVTITFDSAVDCYDTALFTITPNTINAQIGDTITLAQDFTDITIGEQVAAIRGNVNDDVYFDIVDGEVTACFKGAIPTSCTQTSPTEGPLPATVAGAATFIFDTDAGSPVGGIQLAHTVRDGTLTDGWPSVTWTGGVRDTIIFSPVNVNISGTTIELSNPTLMGGVADNLTATVSSGNIELEIYTTDSGSYVGGVEFDFVVDGFTIARVLVYINLTVEGGSY